MRCQPSNVDASGLPKLKRRMASGEKFDRRQQKNLKRMIVGLNGPDPADAKVKLAAFEHRHQGGPRSLVQLPGDVPHNDAGTSKRRHRSSGTWLSPSGRRHRGAGAAGLARRANAPRSGCCGNRRAIARLRRSAPGVGECDRTAYSKLDLEIVDLSGQCGLSNSQAKCCLRHGPLFRNGDERAHVPQIHAKSLCPFGMKDQKNRYWTG
jgi:hypothetical protein